MSNLNLSAYAQKKPVTKGVKAKFYPEKGCPVDVVSIRSMLEVDPFEAPIASRVYITYKNISQRTISGIKFRVQYSNKLGKDLGTLHAPDRPPLGLSSGASRSNKWRKEGGLHPDISLFKVRVLTVKFKDGSVWESNRMKTLTEYKHLPSGSPNTPIQSQDNSQ